MRWISCVCSVGTKCYYFRAAKRLWMIQAPYFAVMGPENITSLDFSLSIPCCKILLIETKEGIIQSVQKTRNLLKSGLSSNGTSLERPSLHPLLSLIYLKRTAFMSLWLCYIRLSPKLECKVQWCWGSVYSLHCYILSTQNCGWSPRWRTKIIVERMDKNEWMKWNPAAIRGKKE